jgi:hypothetical protein
MGKEPTGERIENKDMSLRLKSVFKYQNREYTSGEGLGISHIVLITKVQGQD